MVQPKYNPQEALERVKLMMKYDTSKTLNENKEIIKEQVNCPNAISEDEMEEICNTMWDDLQAMQSLFVRLFYDKKGNAKNIFETINGLIGKNYKDDLSNQCEPAIQAFKRVYKERADEGGWFGFSTDGSIVTELNNLKKDANFEAAGKKAAKYIDAAIQVLNTEKSWNATITDTNKDKNETKQADWSKFYCVPTLAGSKGIKMDANGSYPIGNFRYFTNGRKGNITTKEVTNYTCNDSEFRGLSYDPTHEAGPARIKKSSFKPCSGIYNMGCMGDSVKKIQACLGLVTDGKYGPKTNAKLMDIGYRSFKDEDVEKICGGQKPKIEPEVSGEEITIDTTDSNF